MRWAPHDHSTASNYKVGDAHLTILGHDPGCKRRIGRHAVESDGRGEAPAMPRRLPPKSCHHCDAEVRDDAPYCPQCGTDLGYSLRREEDRVAAVAGAADELHQSGKAFCGALAWFGGLYWAPMFLVATPGRALLVQALLVLVLAGLVAVDHFSLYLSRMTSPQYRWGGRKSRWLNWLRRARKASHHVKILNDWGLASLACVASCLILVVAPPWTGWGWLFPVVAALHCVILLMGRWISHAMD
jgi:hypothetical protein